MKRKMIIVWKWEGLNESEHNNQVEVDNCPEDIIIRIRHQENKSVNNAEITKKIKGILDKDNGFQIILFLHDIKTDGVFKEEDRNAFQESYQKIEVWLFGGGKDPIYKTGSMDNKGLLNQYGNFYTGLYNNKGVEQNNFNFVWNEYYKKKPLIEKKNHLIRKLLPLAIDIQGLSKVKIKKRTDYFSEVRDSYSKEDQSDKDEITKILNEIKDDQIKNHMKKCQTIVDDIISSIEGTDKDFFDNYCNCKKTDSYFPALLQDLAEKFDEKIE